MLQMLCTLVLGWVCAVMVHEASHAIVGRWLGMDVTGVHLFCRRGATSILGGRTLLRHANINVGAALYFGGAVSFRFASDMPRLSRALVSLAGPLVNGALGLYFGLRGESALMLVNFFLMSCSYSDVLEAIEIFCEGKLRKALGVCALSLFALPVVCISVSHGSWYWVIVAFAGLSILGATLTDDPGPALATAK